MFFPVYFHFFQLFSHKIQSKGGKYRYYIFDTVLAIMKYIATISMSSNWAGIIMKMKIEKPDKDVRPYAKKY